MSKWICYLLSIIIVATDQWSKLVAKQRLIPLESVEITSFLNIHLTFNRGAAFSFLSQMGGWQRWFFTGFSLIMSIVLSIWIAYLPKVAKLQATALSLILGGAVGNLIDRVYYGYVTDFIDLHYQHYHWPVFNLADSAITLGALCLIMDMFMHHPTHTQ